MAAPSDNELLAELGREEARFRAIRRWRHTIVWSGRGLVVAAVLAGITVLGRPSEAQEKPDVKASVEAREFIVQDVRGRPRAKLALHKSEPILVIFDQAGENVQAGIGIMPEGANLTLMRDKGQPALSIGEVASDDDSGPHFKLADENGVPALLMAVTSKGPRVGNLYPNGIPASLMTLINKHGAMAVLDDEGRPIWAVGP